MPNEYKITALEGLEAVRQLPGMYLGDTENGQALHHMLMEVIDNSVDEHLSGHCNKIIITLHRDGSASVEDNGRGIPTYYMKDKGMSALEVVFCTLHAGGKFDKENYEISGGLHGVGVSCTNAVSARLRVIVKGNGKEYTMAFAKGKKVEELSEKNIKNKDNGTFIRFAPDNTIFKNILKFDAEMVKTKLRELSYLCNGLTIHFINESDGSKEVFPGESNISDFVNFLSNSKLIADPIFFSEVKDNIKVDISLQWTDDGSEDEISQYYTNNIPNLDGGSHTVGFKSALTRTINNYIANSDLPKTLKVSLTGDDIREGLVAVISIRHPNPRFSSQTKDKLVSEDARAVVENVVANRLSTYLEQNPAIAKKITVRCVNAFKAREAARKARETIRNSSLKSGNIILPGKLADCSSNNPDECEIFIVEGSSAGGSAKQGRNRRFQAILPLRGKVLNVEKCEFQKILKNEELTSLVTALGTGFGRSFDISKLRYGKVILFCDADVDGAHIRTLLLTFFFRQMPQIIMNDNLYIAAPPLYKLSFRGNSYYLRDDLELSTFMKEKGLSKDRVKLQRFKGLGEMNPEQLWNTSMNPETRKMYKVSIENIVETDKIFNILMGAQVDIRRDFIIEHAQFATTDI